MKKLLLFCLLMAQVPIWAQSVFLGKVLDAETKQPLSGAHVQVGDKDQQLTTSESGEFTVRTGQAESLSVTITFVGYADVVETVDLGEYPEGKVFFMAAVSEELQAVEISALRADEKTPIAYTDLDRSDLATLNTGQDIPFILQNTPSVVASSDAGAGIGYTGLRIRGSDQTRINVTVNGVPINDPESHGVFWVNMPDLTSSLNSVQVQRGVGTSTNGAGAFGASINMETNTLEKKPYGEVAIGGGSFNTQRYSVGFGTGLINNHWVLQGRASMIKSDGWIDRASSDLRSYFLTGGFVSENTTVKAVVFGGREKTYQSWNGTDSATYATNPTFNSAGAIYNADGSISYYDNEVDNYGQDHYQLHLNHQMSEDFSFNVSGFYTRGKGYYEQYRQDDELRAYGIDPVIVGGDTITNSDLIRRLWLDNHFYGVNINTTYQANDFALVVGGGVSQYLGGHFGDLQWARFAGDSELRDSFYFNESKKLDYNAFAKLNYSFNSKLNAYVDLQVRGVDYRGEGWDRDSARIDFDDNFLFLNPKLGVNYQVNDADRAYFSVAMANKEPNRSDYTDAPAGEKPEHETLLDFELGYQSTGQKISYEANAFVMFYTNQLVLTGAINDVGAPVRDNVGNSTRMGIELSANYMATSWFSVLPTITYSQSRNQDMILDNGTDLENLGSTRISFSPDLIANLVLEFRPVKDLSVQWIARYVSDQYLTNFTDPSAETPQYQNLQLPAYFVNDFRIEYTPNIPTLESSRFYIQVNNILSEEYASNGYSYEWAGAYYMGFYPQAPANFLAGFAVSF